MRGARKVMCLLNTYRYKTLKIVYARVCDTHSFYKCYILACYVPLQVFDKLPWLKNQQKEVVYDEYGNEMEEVNRKKIF